MYDSKKDKNYLYKPEYNGSILECPKKVPDNIKLHSKCAIFINNPQSNMYDWYKGVIVKINKNTINRNNVDIFLKTRLITIHLLWKFFLIKTHMVKIIFRC